MRSERETDEMEGVEGAVGGGGEELDHLGHLKHIQKGIKLLFFLRDFILQKKKLYINFNIKNKDNKISQGRGNSLRNEVRVG